MSMELQADILNQLRQYQAKFIYYIIALDVTCIGFTIIKTENTSLWYNHIPLGIAILCWGLSIFFGFVFNQIILASLYSNNSLLEIQRGANPKVGDNPQLIEAASQGIRDAIEKNSNKANRNFKATKYLFFMGVLAFLFWHVTEMMYYEI